MGLFKTILPTVLAGILWCCSLPCNAGISIQIQEVSCHGAHDGTITIDYTDSTQTDFRIYVKDSLRKPLAKIDATTNLPITLDNLPAGVYTFSLVKDRNIKKQTIIIESPEPLIGTSITIEDLQGTGSEAKARLRAVPKGGTPPYTFLWSENANKITKSTTEFIPLGIYRCAINDHNNCGPVWATFFLIESEIEKLKANNINRKDNE